MKQCPNCGAQIADDSRFCTECGNPIPQGYICPHCGVSVNEGDIFCQNCGKSLNEATLHVEEVSNSGFKKYLPYILGTIVFLGIVGFFSSNSSNVNNDFVIADSVAVDSVATNVATPISNEMFESMLTQLIGYMDADLAMKRVNKLFTEGYKTYYNRACEKADKEGYEHPRIWWQFSDSDPEIFSVDKLEMTTNDKAKALVKLSSDYYEGRFEVLLNNENGDWLIDKITELGTEYLQVAETTESENIDDVDSQNLDWLQGHWVYEQGSYKGHFIIQGDKITQYSSMNPERETSTFRIEGDELLSRIANGLDLTVKIDFANHTIDYGDGNWMHKVE